MTTHWDTESLCFRGLFKLDRARFSYQQQVRDIQVRETHKNCLQTNVNEKLIFSTLINTHKTKCDSLFGISYIENGLLNQKRKHKYKIVYSKKKEKQKFFILTLQTIAETPHCCLLQKKQK